VPRLRLYRFRSGQEFRTLIPRRGPRLDAGGLRRSAAALDPQGRLLAVSAHDGIALLDVARGEEVGLLPLRENSPLAFLQSGELLTCGSSGLLRWPVQVDPDTGQRRYGPPQCLTVKTSENDQGASADGRVLAIPISNDGALVLHQDDAVWARQCRIGKTRASCVCNPKKMCATVPSARTAPG